VREFEPHDALYGGEDGMAIIEHIIKDALRYLTPDGQLWIEHEPEYVTYIHRLATESGLTAETNPDQYDTPRYSVFRRQLVAE
jgi:release factor glutamine methyltransferase